jgi:CDP-diacylglycerol--glycerol-3-phosphate 3-phosphatidyltransferase
MTLPNKLTMLRIILVPVMVVIAFIPYLNSHYIFNSLTISNFICLIIFAIASITDFLDGKIARKYNLVTTFGKFADPLADKMLVTSAMVILCLQMANTKYWWFMPAWGLILILCRDLIVDGVRFICAGKGETIAADMFGKIKTFVTMFALVFLFLWQIDLNGEGLLLFGYIGMVLMYVGILFTVISGFRYVYRARKVIFESI